MNWFDIVIIAILVLSALWGMRTGLIGAALIVIGVFVGWILAVQFSDDVGELFSDSLSNDTLVTVVSYGIIILASLVVARVIGRIGRSVLAVVTMGLSSMVDRLGGLVLGLIAGGAISATLIIAMARVTYNFELPAEGVAGTVVGQIPNVEATRGAVEGALAASLAVPVLIEIRDALPANALGFIPSDFKVSLDILKQNIE